MKKTKPVKKVNKTFRLFLLSLFKNDAAIEGGRKAPWWMAVILFVASIIIASIPTMITQGSSRGDSVFTGSQYQTDIGLVKFGEALNEQGVNLVYDKDANGEFVLNNTGEVFKDKFTDKISLSSIDDSSVDFHYYSFSQLRARTVTNATTNEPEEILESFEYLRVYYTADITKSFAVSGKTYNAFEKLNHYLANLTPDMVAASSDANLKVTSHIILGKSNLVVRIYNPTDIFPLPGNGTSAITAVRAVSGYTSGLKEATNLTAFVSQDTQGNLINATDREYVTKVQANWKKLINVTHEPVKIATFWESTAFMILLNFIITLFIGLIFFITTRGKYNPNRDIKFIESIKIGAWLALSPALITLILGPLLGSMLGGNTIMIYIMTLGMRSVWVSMKTTQPVAK